LIGARWILEVATLFLSGERVWPASVYRKLVVNEVQRPTFVGPRLLPERPGRVDLQMNLARSLIRPTSGRSLTPSESAQPTDQSFYFRSHKPEIDQVRDRKGQEASP
jgi:hypothetical protein